MRQPYQTAIMLTTTLTLAASIVAASGYFLGVRINLTPSVPRGIYLTTSGPIQPGAMVAFCPPDEPLFRVARARTYLRFGLCPGSYAYMIKQVAAMGGDTISATDRGITVNGLALVNSAPILKDTLGRDLPTWRVSQLMLNEHELLLMSASNPASFDGRYFGLVNQSSVRATLKPFIIFKD